MQAGRVLELSEARTLQPLWINSAELASCIWKELCSIHAGKALQQAVGQISAVCRLVELCSIQVSRALSIQVGRTLQHLRV
jgi:hypothetical protein